jgi:hypothetical protein
MFLLIIVVLINEIDLANQVPPGLHEEDHTLLVDNVSLAESSGSL